MTGQFFGAEREEILANAASLEKCFIGYLIHTTDGGPEGKAWPMDITIKLKNGKKILENGKIHFQVAGDPVAGYIVFERTQVNSNENLGPLHIVN